MDASEPYLNKDIVVKVLTGVVTAAKDGVKLSLDNTAEIAQLSIGITAIALNFIPVAGPILFGAMTVLGLILFPAPDADPWVQVRERVEELIGFKIEKDNINSLNARNKGFYNNAEDLRRAVKIFNESKDPESKEKNAEYVRLHLSGLLGMLRGFIPEFQIESHAVAALPLFSRAAHLHLSLLANGMKNGLEWGYSTDVVNGEWPALFEKLTASGNSGNAARDLTMNKSRAGDLELEMFKDAIDNAERFGVRPELVALWKEAYDLVKEFATNEKRAAGDYVSHVKKYYAKGRSQVKFKTWDAIKPYHFYGTGHNEALEAQAYADYDNEMLDSVLTYSEFWPYLDGKTKTPNSVIKSVTREVFHGPYGRHTDNVPWNRNSPAPVTDRRDKITAVKLCVWENVKMLQVKYGDKWDPVQGVCKNEKEEGKGFELAADEYIENVDIRYDHKLYQLTFTTTQGNTYGPFGPAHKAGEALAVNRTGSYLTSMHTTRYVSHPPEGLEGIIFGFTPQIAAK